MLKSIHIEQFKSYKNQDLPLAPLTLLIGANASGKSNALEAFRFLCWIAQGQKLSVLKHRVDDGEQVLRGRVDDLGYIKSSTFTLGCQVTEKDWDQFDIEIAIRSGDLHIIQEMISCQKEIFPLYRVEQPSAGVGTDIRVSYNNFTRGGRKPQLVCTDQIAVMCQLASSAMFAANHKRAQIEIPRVTNDFQDLLATTIFLDPVPSLMRGDSYIESTLRGDCSNISGVLYSLWSEPRNRKYILEFIKSLPEQDIIGIKFFKDKRNRVYLELRENFGNVEREWSVELLSDGTLRVLAIAAALLSAPAGATVVIEEVDNGVHPSRARKLLNTMREQANRRGVRLLLTTHNPALMDALPDEALGDVVFCYRGAEEGDTKLVRLSDLEDYAGLVSQGPLGELVTSGIVDRFVKSPVSRIDKKNHALQWLERMRGEAK